MIGKPIVSRFLSLRGRFRSKNAARADLHTVGPRWRLAVEGGQVEWEDYSNFAMDYVTSPGWLEGKDSRVQAGLVRGGPSAVVTTMGVLRFRPDTKNIYLDSYHPGLTPQDVVEATGFPLEVEGASETLPPTQQELCILRQEVDPERIFLR